LGLGNLGLKPVELYQFTPRQFHNAVSGFMEHENNKEIAKWERMRFSTTALINIQLTSGKKINPEKLIKFDWDKKKPKQYLTADQFEALVLKK
jgi:hypothetical protein